jgi:DNA modification methylase
MEQTIHNPGGLPLDQIILGDNLELLSRLPDRCIDLAYLDGPYYTGKDWGDFGDKFETLDSYIDFMRPRLEQGKRVLKVTGSIYLSCDYHANHYLKVEMDRIFGRRNFINELVWDRNNKGGFRSRKRFITTDERILFYSKTEGYTFNMQYRRLSAEEIKRKFPHDDNDGRGPYAWAPMNCYRNVKDLEKGLKEGKYKWPEKSKYPGYKLYAATHKGTPSGTVIKGISTTVPNNKQNYATEKPEALLELPIRSSSNPGDIVLEVFCGSAPACAVAKRLGRRYIGFDINPRAVKIATERLARIPG